MALNMGQLLGGAGIVANRQREAETAMLNQRENLMRVQEANRLQEIRARMGEGANEAASAPFPEFVQSPGTVVGNPNAAPAAAPAANAPAAAPVAGQPATRPVAQPSNRAPAAAPAAPAAAMRTPDQLVNIPTDQLTAAEFQALSPQQRLQRLQNLNRDRQAAIDRAQLGKAPAAAADIFAGGPYNAVAGGLTWAGNALGVPRIGRALGIYDSDVTRVEVPKVGTGSATPYYDMIRQTEQANQPLNEAQLLERLKTGETTRAKAAEAERAKNVTASQKEGYADWQLDAKGKPVRGLVNNNPGNIRPDKAYTWQGATGQAGGFVQFDSPEAGIRAMTLNLLSYNQRGINNVQGIINRWAPESDNNKTGDYIAYVTKALGVKPTDTLNLQDAATMRQLVSSIIQFENGKNPYDARTIDTGIALGFNRDAPVVTAGSGKAPALPAATQTVTQAVATGTPADVATAASTAVRVEPSKDGTMYGPAQLDASARNPQIQQILTTRAALQKQVALFNQYGMGDKAWEAVSKIQALDIGLYKNQADIGVYEGATTGNFSRAMSVLSTFTGAPHQVMRRPDGNFDLYINGKVAKAGLNGAQVEQLVRTQVDSSYRQQLAALQTKQAEKRFETDEDIRKETSKQVVQTAREIQLELIKGNTKLAEEKIKLAGFKAIGTNSGDGKVIYSNGAGDIFVVDTQNKTATINGATVDLGVSAQRVSGVDRSIWSSVNAPQQQVR
jgi:hypothetical protein